MSKVSPITVQGFLAQDVETRQAGSANVAEVTVPHTRRKKNSQTGQYEDAGETTWFKAPFWNDDIAKVAGLKKGTPVILTGELSEVRAYVKGDGKAGANVVLAFATVAVVPQSGQSQQAPAPAPQQQGDVWGTPGTTYNDEAPF